MMKNQRLLRLLALLFSFTLIAAACGGDDDDEATGDDDTSAGEESTDGDDDDMAEEGDDDMAEEGDDDMAEDEGDSGSAGGTLIWAHEQEPPDLHLNDPNNNLTITSWIIQPMWEDLYAVNASVAYEPELLAEEATITENGDGTVTINYVLRDGLTWSDGTPLTSSDVEFTYNTIFEADGEDEDGNPAYVLSYSGRNTGYNLITSFNVISDTEFSIDMESFFAGWKGMFTNIMPAHALPGGAAEAEDALREWTNAAGDILPSSGPLVFNSWERGVELTYDINENYHGSVSSDASSEQMQVDTVVVRFVTDTDAQINALKAEEAHLITAQPQLAFGDEIVSEDRFTAAASPGPIWEHWGMNLNNVHLADPLVREALAYWFDKGQVMEGLYTPLFGDALPAEGLGNTYWMANQPDYVDQQTAYAGPQTDAAKANLEAAGYSDSGDGIYEHPERGRLTLRIGTTGGNALRELQQQILQQQGAAGGFEIVIDNVPGSDYFSEKPFSEAALAAAASGGAEGDATVWDLTQFAWVGGPWPGGASQSFAQTSGFAPYGLINDDFEALAVECDATIDDAARADCYNELSLYTTTLELDAEQGLFVLPITQKPTFYAFNNELLSSAGASPDVNTGGPLANVVDFALAG